MSVRNSKLTAITLGIIIVLFVIGYAYENFLVLRQGSTTSSVKQTTNAISPLLKSNIETITGKEDLHTESAHPLVFSQSGFVMNSTMNTTTIYQLYRQFSRVYADEAIPLDLLLTTDMRLYLHKALVSLTRKMVYMNVIRHYRGRIADRQYTRIIQYHGYNNDRIRDRPNDGIPGLDYEPDYSSVPRLLCVFEPLNSITNSEVEYMPYSFASPITAQIGPLAANIECELPDEYASRIAQKEQVKLILLEMNTPVNGSIRIGKDQIVNRVLGKFELKHPLDNLNIDPAIHDKFYAELSSSNGGVYVERPLLFTVTISPVFIEKLPYMLEFIEYYRMVGADHFIIYISVRTKAHVEKFEQLLQYYIQQKLVTLVVWAFGITERMNNLQVVSVMDSNFRLMDYSEWFAVIDTDEYIIPMKNDTLRPVIRKYTTTNFHHPYELMVLHAFYTQKGNVSVLDPTLNILQKYTYSSDVLEMNRRTKYIARVGYIPPPMEVHSILYNRDNPSDSRRKVMDANNEIRLAHFFTSQKARTNFGIHKDEYISNKFGLALAERLRDVKLNMTAKSCGKGETELC
jgi:hypothetical protein